MLFVTPPPSSIISLEIIKSLTDRAISNDAVKIIYDVFIRMKYWIIGLYVKHKIFD